ncbi:MAG: TetR/AcrR family transcriptional regulator [Ktedonobacterales bacterium]
MSLTPPNFACIIINMKSRRPYIQLARAESTAETRARILDATTELLKARFHPDIHLADIAASAQVSVQTILRTFGGREALIESALIALSRHISEQRDRAVPGDIPGAIAGLFDHYEEVGDIVLRTLADEADPATQPMVGIGRTRHRTWIETHFAPQLERHDASSRQRLVDALVCICDVYTWKLLRRDMGRSRPEAESTMAWMVTSILGEA